MNMSQYSGDYKYFLDVANKGCQEIMRILKESENEEKMKSAFKRLNVNLHNELISLRFQCRIHRKGNKEILEFASVDYPDRQHYAYIKLFSGKSNEFIAIQIVIKSKEGLYVYDIKRKGNSFDEMKLGKSSRMPNGVKARIMDVQNIDSLN